MTDLLVGTAYTNEPLPLNQLPQVPSWDSMTASAVSGSQGSYDALSTIVSWRVPPQLYLYQGWPSQRPEFFLVQRSQSPSGPWRTIAVLTPDGQWLADDTPRPIMPSEGHVVLEEDTIFYWDVAVVDGQRYYYHVVGCSHLGGLVYHTEPVATVAADPNPETAHSWPGYPSLRQGCQ